jgi:hypothetical protein
MKKYFTIILVIAFQSIYADGGKFVNFRHNTLMVVEGTEYVIVSFDNRDNSQNTEAKSKELLFINTTSGQFQVVEFPVGTKFGRIEQVKIDSLGINKIIVNAQTFDINGKDGIDLQDPQQIYVLSFDGKLKTKLVDDNFYTNTYTINKLTGTIVITGNYDSKNNNDIEDKNHILIYELKSLSLIGKI